MKGSTSEASIYFHVRTVRQNQRAARRAAAASKDAGVWSQNKKEARAKRVFTFMCERYDKNQRAARRAAAASKDAGFWSQNKKEARAKRVFTFMCERYDKIKEQRGALLDFGV